MVLASLTMTMLKRRWRMSNKSPYKIDLENWYNLLPTNVPSQIPLNPFPTVRKHETYLLPEEEGIRFDQGKTPVHLLPPELLIEVAKVLDFGAKKYSFNYRTEWDRLLDAKDVIKIKITTPTTDVVHVMKKNSEELILSSQNDKDKTVGIGRNEIQTKLRNTPDVGLLIQDAVNEMRKLGEKTGFVNWGLRKNNLLNTSQKDVPFVDPVNTFTLTIVTTQGSFEESYALNTTMDLDFWETIWWDLCKQFSISKPLNGVGTRNWEKGMDWSRVYSSLMRHLLAWWNGEDNDPETGLPHVAHIATNAAFLVAYNARNVGKDDRPVKEKTIGTTS